MYTYGVDCLVLLFFSMMIELCPLGRGESLYGPPRKIQLKILWKTCFAKLQPAYVSMTTKFPAYTATVNSLNKFHYSVSFTTYLIMMNFDCKTLFNCSPLRCTAYGDMVTLSGRFPREPYAANRTVPITFPIFLCFPVGKNSPSSCIQ